jgi:hypothetical protein
MCRARRILTLARVPSLNVQTRAGFFLLAPAWPELLAIVWPRFSTVAACRIGVAAVSGVIVAVAHLAMTTGSIIAGLSGSLTDAGYGLLVIGETTCCPRHRRCLGVGREWHATATCVI